MAFIVESEDKQNSPPKLPEHEKFVPLSQKLATGLVALAFASGCVGTIPNPPETNATSAPGITETQGAGFSLPLIDIQQYNLATEKSYPDNFAAYADKLKDLAAKDGLDINQLGEVNWIQAADKERGTSVSYALMPMAIVHNLTDPDGQPSNPHPVYYMVYQDKDGQIQSAYVLGKLIEQDKEGNVSNITRILDEATFRQWQTNTQLPNGEISLGQIVYSIPLDSKISVEEARKLQQQLTSGEISPTDYMKNNALGLMLIQPGQQDQRVTFGIPGTGSPTESIIDKLLALGASRAMAAPLEFSATATAPQQTTEPTVEPTQIIEPTPMAEPTLSVEQQQQAIMDQFVNEPFYDQYIADNQIPEQAATAFYNQYSDADGESFAVVTMKVDPNSLSEEQKALNIPQRDYLVVKTADGQLEFKLLPVNLQLETFSKSAVEFTLSKEYQQGLQDYLNAMGLETGAVTIQQTQKEINGEAYRFLVATPDQINMTIEQREYVDIYGETPLFKCDEIEWNLVGLKNFFSFGTSTIWDLLDTSKREYNSEREKYKKIFLKDFSNYTAQFGWEHIQPDGPEKFNFSILDWQFGQLKKMGLYNDLNFTAQSLILQQPPDWLKNGNYNRDQIIEFMQKYINTVISRYSGQIDQMVIVNEPAGNLKGWTRDDFFNSKIGPEYIDIAFQTARNADPNIILIFNDTDNHFKGGHTTQNTIKVVKRLKEKELIDGVGVQLHLDGAQPFNKEDFIKTLKEYIGLSVYITEFDIDMSNVYGTLEQRQKIQARIAKLVMEGILESGVVVSFTMWEAPGDKFNWLENYLNKDKADGTFWTDNLDPKQSYYAATQALWNSQ